MTQEKTVEYKTVITNFRFKPSVMAKLAKL